MNVSRKDPIGSLQHAPLVQSEKPGAAETSEIQTNAIQDSEEKSHESIQSAPPFNAKSELSAKEAAKVRFEHRLGALSRQVQLSDAEKRSQDQSSDLGVLSVDQEVRESDASGLVPQEGGQKGLSAKSDSTPSISHDHIYQHNQTDLEFLRSHNAPQGFEVRTEDTKLSPEKREVYRHSNIESKKK